MSGPVPDRVGLALQSFAEGIGLEALEPDETGYFALESDRDEVIHGQWQEEPGAGCLELSVMVSRLGGGESAAGMRLLLEANFAGFGARGGVFALRPDSDEVWYFCHVAAERLMATSMEQALEQCFEVSELWRAQLAGAPAASGDAAEVVRGERV